MKKIIFLTIVLTSLTSCVNQRQKGNITGRTDEVYFTPSDLRLKAKEDLSYLEKLKTPSPQNSKNYAQSYSDRLNNFGSGNRYNNYHPTLLPSMMYSKHTGWLIGFNILDTPNNSNYCSCMSSYYNSYTNPYMINYWSPFGYGYYGGNSYSYYYSSTNNSYYNSNYSRRTNTSGTSIKPQTSSNNGTKTTNRSSDSDSKGWWNNSSGSSSGSSTGNTSGNGNSSTRRR